MGRPAIIPFKSLTHAKAIEGVQSILKIEHHTTVEHIATRLKKRITVADAEESEYSTKILAAVVALSQKHKVTLEGDKVSVILGKRGRPSKKKISDTPTSITFPIVNEKPEVLTAAI